MKFLDDIRNLDRNNVGGWPQSVKIFFTVLLCAVVLLIGWYFFVGDQQDSLKTLAGKEDQLKQEFSTKQAKSVNLEALQQQLDEMQDMLRQLLRQLPSKTEMPELLVDVSQTAQSAGLESDLFQPGPETPKDFYAEKPITLRMTGTSHNISKRKRAEERAEYLATRDALTGLPNRVLLHDRLEQCIFNAARNQVGFAFMFIDLDRFKTINDSLGHQVGDELLKRVASRLTACVRATDTVARLGGDEFAVILENLDDDDDEGAQEVAEKMIAAMGAPMLIESQHLSTSCSIGISLYPNDGRDSEALMKNADVAMYYAKEKGRNNYQFFSQDMNARAQERLSVENYLRLALRRNELVLHYQPRVKVETGELVGVEALVRWQHPRRGLLMPDRFIGVAEDSGLIVPIGEWVLDHACKQLREWQAHAPGLKLAVNLSVGQIADGERLLRAVEGALRGAGVPARALELELTESHLMQDIAEKSAFLHRLGEIGVGLAIDDFGTGYSSLSYLKSLPVDSIKIDSSFVRDIGADPNDEAIIRAIVAMAHSLHLVVVAEGVETADQLAALRELGCDEYQGFLESVALGAAEFSEKYLR